MFVYLCSYDQSELFFFKFERRGNSCHDRDKKKIPRPPLPQKIIRNDSCSCLNKHQPSSLKFASQFCAEDIFIVP